MAATTDSPVTQTSVPALSGESERQLHAILAEYNEWKAANPDAGPAEVRKKQQEHRKEFSRALRRHQRALAVERAAARSVIESLFDELWAMAGEYKTAERDWQQQSGTQANVTTEQQDLQPANLPEHLVEQRAEVEDKRAEVKNKIETIQGLNESERKRALMLLHFDRDLGRPVFPIDLDLRRAVLRHQLDQLRQHMQTGWSQLRTAGAELAARVTGKHTNTDIDIDIEDEELTVESADNLDETRSESAESNSEFDHEQVVDWLACLPEQAASEQYPSRLFSDLNQRITGAPPEVEDRALRIGIKIIEDRLRNVEFTDNPRDLMQLDELSYEQWEKQRPTLHTGPEPTDLIEDIEDAALAAAAMARSNGFTAQPSDTETAGHAIHVPSPNLMVDDGAAATAGV
ncbi:hypothetical protein ACL02S_23415 [Nocardia sp. 004]|uniref:hypothetical protein n=1 Tax=Nocardia sp. 004 TaxID=3385978 RepID=UPI0039A35BED